jgi:hypothetical protein
MALVNQKMGAAQGNPNYVLYDLPAKQANAFHDIATGSTNAMPCATGTANCVTNTKTDAVGMLSGWATTTGYDLATGLGSVDVANLVNNWNKVTYTPTTTALTVSVPANTVHGTPLPVTISVTPSPGSGTANLAEDVSLLISPGTPGSTPPSPGIDWNTLSNGTITWDSYLLPGGTYKVVAHYEGDGTYGGSYSAPSASITIKPEASFVYMPGVVTVNGTANTVVYGTGEFIAYLLRADVQNSQQNFCSPPAYGNEPLNIACPTGTITFTDNGKTLDASPYKLNSAGYTEDQTIELTGGSHTLAATYSGDASYQPSSISGISVTVTKAPTFILDVSAPSTASAGQQFTVAALVTTQSAGVAPTGTVSFFSTLTGGSPVQLPGTVTLTPTNGNVSTNTAAALSAGLTTSIGTAGTYKITATYSGDTNYQAVTAGQSNTATVVVGSAGSFTVGSIAAVTISAPGQSGTAQVTVTPSGGFQGTVNINCTLPTAMSESSCSPLPAVINGTTAVTTTVTINTTPPSSAAIRPAATGMFAFGVLAGVFVFAIPGLRRKKAPLALLLFMLVALIVSCGGGSSSGPPPNQGTPPGTYTVNLTATNGSTSVPASFSVTVQ